MENNNDKEECKDCKISVCVVSKKYGDEEKCFEYDQLKRFHIKIGEGLINAK